MWLPNRPRPPADKHNGRWSTVSFSGFGISPVTFINLTQGGSVTAAPCDSSLFFCLFVMKAHCSDSMTFSRFFGAVLCCDCGVILIMYTVTQNMIAMSAVAMKPYCSFWSFIFLFSASQLIVFTLFVLILSVQSLFRFPTGVIVYFPDCSNSPIQTCDYIMAVRFATVHVLIT